MEFETGNSELIDRHKYVLRSTLVILLAILYFGPVAAFAQFGSGSEFPQFRSMAGLPGNGIGLTKEGKPGFDGAFSLNVPVAFSFRRGAVAHTAGNVSRDSRLRWFDFNHRTSTINDANGTHALQFGFEVFEGHPMTVGVMVLSRVHDTAVNLHYQTPWKSVLPNSELEVVYGLGVQDISGEGGYKGEDDPEMDRNSTSFYGVATVEMDRDYFVSAGIGSGRYRKGFVNASRSLGRSVKGFVEHDGYGLGYGLAFGKGQVVASVGFTHGNKAFFTFGVGR